MRRVDWRCAMLLVANAALAAAVPAMFLADRYGPQVRGLAGAVWHGAVG